MVISLFVWGDFYIIIFIFLLHNYRYYHTITVYHSNNLHHYYNNTYSFNNSSSTPPHLVSVVHVLCERAPRPRPKPFYTMSTYRKIDMYTVRSHFDPFDRGIGNGSSSGEDDYIDQGRIYGGDNDWANQSATTFNAAEAPTKEQKFHRLYKLNQGKGEQSRRDTIRASHINNDLETFMSVLEMPLRQRQIVRDIIDEVGIDSNTFGGVTYEKIILTTCSLVADEALSQNGGSFSDRLFLSDKYKELMRATNMGSQDHRKLRVKIRDKSSHFD